MTLDREECRRAARARLRRQRLVVAAVGAVLVAALLLLCAAPLLTSADAASGAALGAAEAAADPVKRPVPAPTLVKRRLPIGSSVRGRPLLAVETGNPASPRKTVVIGCIHGNECAGLAIVKLLEATPPAPSI